MLHVWSALCSQVCREGQEKGEGRGRLGQNGHETFYHFECDFFLIGHLVVTDFQSTYKVILVSFLLFNYLMFPWGNEGLEFLTLPSC